jgi:transposase
MIPVPSGVGVWLAVGHTDMRRGMNGLALQVQQALGRNPHAGDLHVFRGRRGDLVKIVLVKIVWHDGLGILLYAKRLERGRFIWPAAADGRLVLLQHADDLLLPESRSLRHPSPSDGPWLIPGASKGARSEAFRLVPEDGALRIELRGEFGAMPRACRGTWRRSWRRRRPAGTAVLRTTKRPLCVCRTAVLGLAEECRDRWMRGRASAYAEQC